MGSGRRRRDRSVTRRSWCQQEETDSWIVVCCVCRCVARRRRRGPARPDGGREKSQRRGEPLYGVRG